MRVKLYHVADESLISQNKTSSLFLIDDNWDDFGYKTRFKLYYVDQRGKSHEIGPLKITYKGYRADSAMAQYYYRKPADRLFYGESKLFAEFCSLGESLEYYENLWRNFPDEKEHNIILKMLRDAATDDAIYNEFRNDESFKRSLLRESSSYKALTEARMLRLPIGTNCDNKDLRFTYAFYAPYLNQYSKPIQIRFDFSKNELPYRIHVLVGKNGTGKTQLLNAMAESLSGITGSDVYDNCGFIGERPVVDRVISMSYSAFDDGFKNRESSREASTVSYVYCGIHSNQGLLSMEELNKNFEKARERIITKRRQKDWESIMKELMEKEFESIIPNVFENGIDGVFMSSGQRILMSTVTEVVSNIENGSILLIDELELHLHPNAMSNAMRMLYKLLELFDSYAIIATHSPLIVQEIPKKYVHVLYRLDNNLVTSNPLMECFGRDVTGITDEVFDVLSVESNYKTVLRELSKKYDYGTVLEFFDGVLPLSASIYLSNCYSDGV